MAKIFKNRKIIFLEETASTNSYISGFGSDLPDGSVVWTGFQSQGKGQGKNSWESERNLNLLLSIKVLPTFLKASEQFYISKVISLAVADFANLYADNISIKWPNDIYYKNSKLAGILIENSIMGTNIKESIIGAGININQVKFNSQAPNPISLYNITGATFELETILDVFLSIFDYRFEMLINGEKDTIDENYLELLYRKNEIATFISDNKTFKGKITGVEKSGELKIKDQDGNNRHYWHKEVEFVI